METKYKYLPVHKFFYISKVLNFVSNLIGWLAVAKNITFISVQLLQQKINYVTNINSILVNDKTLLLNLYTLYICTVIYQ